MCGWKTSGYYGNDNDTRVHNLRVYTTRFDDDDDVVMIMISVEHESLHTENDCFARVSRRGGGSTTRLRIGREQ